MSSMPRRDDDTYKEIENFKDYELTQCIIYEMAIRNSENQKKINTIREYYYDNQEKIFQMQQIRTKGLVPKFSDEFETIQELIRDVDCLFYDFEDKRLKVYDVLQSINQHKMKYSTEGINDISEDLSERTLREGYIYENELLKINNLVTDEFAHIGSINIIRNFQRPEIMMKRIASLNISVNIDISKPLDEIISYIKHIKTDLEKNQDIVKAPIELLGKQIEKADNVICSTKGKCFNAREILSKQQKMADMFYIFDGLQYGMTQRKIQNEIYNYYADKGIETKTMDFKTLKRYKELAIDYIENMRYKELVTGVKQ